MMTKMHICNCAYTDLGGNNNMDTMETIDFERGFAKVGVDNSMKMEIACEITEYIINELISQTCFDYPIEVEDENGDVHYTEEAQDLFNEHYDQVSQIINIGLGLRK